ncbi:hypothetical protein LBMAG57_37200 [Verrucomicrobiota bacterium]|nr:hypothetical protein LBMAG57_37200 [Verrucomicrobiota bacterium]
MKDKAPSRGDIVASAKRITDLHDRIHETFKQRDRSPEARAEWSKACAEFHSQYDALAFPGGYASALKKIQAGDSRAIEDAVAFLEVRPYFFHSQYIRTKLTRLLKHAQLTARQAERFQRALDADKKKRARTTYAIYALRRTPGFGVQLPGAAVCSH